MEQTSKSLFPQLLEVINKLDIAEIPEGRKQSLQILTDYIQEKLNKNETVNLNFICTHNSRRSHLSQAWARAMAAYFKVPRVHSYSGGTEATALFPKAAETLKDAGFEVNIISETNNPVYSIKTGPNELPLIGFSKTFDHSFNPKSDFAAIMTCSQADEGCPFIPGAVKRIAIPFDDPKEFDNTAQQSEKYKERSLQIATELYLVFSQINRSNG